MMRILLPRVQHHGGLDAWSRSRSAGANDTTSSFPSGAGLSRHHAYFGLHGCPLANPVDPRQPQHQRASPSSTVPASTCGGATRRDDRQPIGNIRPRPRRRPGAPRRRPRATNTARHPPVLASTACVTGRSKTTRRCWTTSRWGRTSDLTAVIGLVVPAPSKSTSPGWSGIIAHPTLAYGGVEGTTFNAE